MNRKWTWGVAPLLLVGGASSGCAPRLSPDDLGTIEHEIPKIEGADQPYPLPELETPAESDATARDSAGENSAGDGPAEHQAAEANPDAKP